MAAPSDQLAFDETQALAATARWRSRAQARDSNQHALSQGRFDAVETKERLAKRVTRLLARAADDAADRTASPLPVDLRARAGTTVSAGEVTNALFERVIDSTRDFLDVGYFDQGRAAARAVARIVTDVGRGQHAYATGFLVSPSLLLTNNHVLPAIDAARASVAEFDYARDGARQSLTTQTFDLRPDLFFLTAPELDFALVAVAPTSKLGVALATYGRLPLIADEGKITVGEMVNIVQHPKGEMKQVVVRKSELCDMPGAAVGGGLDLYAYYHADTEPGSSGSPVFNDQWEVIALHHTSVPRTDAAGNLLDRDGNVWAKGDDPTRLDWVANEGVRVSRLMAFLARTLAGLPAGDAGRHFLEELVPAGAAASLPSLPPPTPPRAPPPAPPSITFAPAQQSGITLMTPEPITAQLALDAGAEDVTITVPLRITIALGRPAAARPAAPCSGTARKSAGTPVIQENFLPDPDYANRPGYQRSFVGFDLPLPTVDNSVATQVAKLEDGSSELKYNHYSVIMNADRRLAFVSAANVDVEARAQVGREGTDRWSFDPRLPKSLQTGPEVYAANPLDRGHLTRRQDGAWGDTQDEAQKGNDDTFHWTNCSPQHETFNQSQKASKQGLLLWGNLENHVTDEAKSNHRRISVFNGPVFRRDDRAYRGVNLPQQFWKLIAMRGDDGRPNAVAFLLSQADLIADLPQENFEPGAFQPFQIKITELERLSRLDFGDLFRADPLNVDGAERFFERDVAAVRISRPGDIVLHGKV